MIKNALYSFPPDHHQRKNSKNKNMNTSDAIGTLSLKALWQRPACQCLFILLPLTITTLFSPWSTLQLLALGMLLGATLNLFHFGFTRAYYSMVVQRHTLGMRAILFLLGFSSLLFFPLLSESDTLRGFYRPVSLSLVIGSMVFGVGMFLAGTCSSGTLSRVGSLSMSAIATLTGLIAGATLAAWQYEVWQTLPALAPIRFLDLDWRIALVGQLTIITALYALAIRFESSRHGKADSLLTHPWLWAIILLTLGNLTTLLLTGQPWSIATTYPYWGLRLNDQLGGPIQDWGFWSYTAQMAILFDQAPWQAPISVMAIGLILGSLTVNVLRADKTLSKPFQWYQLPVALLGGVLMGYGAIIAYGCNVGALFSGIASGSLHGWIWFASSLAGYALAVNIQRKWALRRTA